ncbi:MAG: SDR family oxidoreductase [Spirochaetia bacterium]|nr:SDR family oxidoreductase [Spirochaetia bacterium]
MKLKGKNAIVTGAGSGMGLAMANLFSSEGAKLILGDWNQQRLDKVVSDIKAKGGEAIGIHGNIADKAIAESLVEKSIEAYGKLDILCNNAGIMDYMQGIDEVTDEIWNKVLEINLFGPMYATRKAVPFMKKNKGGSIINTVSTAGLHGGAAGVAYTTSKHGLIGLTRNTAWFYAKEGIRCNAICPGGTATNIADTMPKDKLSAFGSQRAGVFGGIIPAFLQPLDIANLALFLASDDSKNINGAIINADAGWGAA